MTANATAAVIEQVVVGLSFFIVYGLLYRETGAEQVGILSLIMILASIGSMAGAGFASALGHFVPSLERDGKRLDTVSFIDTTIICTLLIYIFILIVAYIPLLYMITNQVGENNSRFVKNLFPLVAIYSVILGAGSANSLILTALMRNDLRLWSTGIGAIVCIVVLVIGVPHYGIYGGTIALIAQATTTAVLAWMQLIKILPELGPVPYRFRRSTAQKVLGLGSNVQLQTLLLAAIEPTTRLVIGHFGTLSSVADFSLASRFVIQMRALIFSGAQPLLAGFSHHRNNSLKIVELYRSAQATVATLAVIIFSGSIAAAPFVEEAWTGSSAGMFTIFVALLSIGWLANTVTLPAYFNAYSLGKMNRSLLGHAVLCALNLVLGVGLGFWFGSVGAVAGLVAALIVSSIFLGVANGRLAPPETRGVFGYKDAVLLAISSAASACGFAGYFIARPGLDPIFAGLASGLVWAIVLMPAFAFHQTLRTMAGQLGMRLSSKR